MPTYTIPLRSQAIKTQKYKRARKAVKTLHAFIAKHQKTEKIRISSHLNNHLWKDGIRNFPKNVKVNAEKDEKGVVNVELFGYEPPKPAEETPKADSNAEEPKKADAGPAKEADARPETKEPAGDFPTEKRTGAGETRC